MADELVIEGLRLSPPAGDDPGISQGRFEVDAILETDFDVWSRGSVGLSITGICLEIDRLCASGPFESLEVTVVTVVDGLLEIFPQIEGMEMTLKWIDPVLPGTSAGAVGARRRRRRAQTGPLQRRTVVRPRPR